MQIALRFAILLQTLLLLSSLPARADENKPEAKEIKFTAMLIWGTDGEQPEDKDLKQLDGDFVEKLKKIFKWKNYFEVKSLPFAVKPGDAKTLTLSRKCEVKVCFSEAQGMEVELFGEGKSVVKRTQSMPLNDVLILAGDDKDATAWFVVIKPDGK